MTTNSQGTPPRAAVCARVSSLGQVQGTSLESQVNDCQAYADGRGWEVVGTYVDGGVSGKLAHRPSLDRLMADCRAGRLDAVIVAKHDRFGRSFRHTVALIGELDDLGIEFVSIAERIDNSPAGRLQRNMLLSVAEFERERILERTTSGIEATARAGNHPSGRPPYGWKTSKGSSGHSRMIVDPKEAAVWEQIVSCLVDRGMSTLETARELNASGATRRQGGPWSADYVWRLARNTTCLSGTWVYRKPNPSKQLLGPPIEVPIPAILTPERHAALMSVLDSRRARKRVKHEWLLSRLISSPHGMVMWGSVSSHGQRTYYCSGKKPVDGGKESGCDCYSVYADGAENEVWEKVGAVLDNPDLLVEAAEEQAGRYTSASEAQLEDLASLDRRITRMERDAGEKLAQALAAGVDPKVAAVASAKLSAGIEELRERRNTVAVWVADSETRRSRTNLIQELAEQAATSLGEDMAESVRRRILEVLDVKVQVIGWAECGVCHGSGKRIGGRPGESCSDCKGMRRETLMRITGAIPAVGAGSGKSSAPIPIRFAISA